MVALVQAGAAWHTDAIVPLTGHTALTQWEFAPAVTAGLVAVAVIYLVGVWRVRRDHPARPWPVGCTLSFFAGLAVIALATQSSVGAYDDVLFWIHMVQHLLLLMVAPPLLILGRPATLLLHASRNPLHSRVKRLLRGRLVSAITFPLVGVALYAAVVVGTHLTGFMNLTLQHPPVHDAEHVLYLVAGYLYFLPLVGREPVRWRLPFTTQLFLLFVAMPVDTFTGVVLMQTNHAMFSAYSGRRDWGPSLVDDLHAGGAVMWIGGDAIMLAIIVAVFARVLRSRQPVDAGRWIESIRRQRFADLSGSPDTGASITSPDDDGQLDAYNDYLARLNRPGSRRAP